MRQSPSLSFHDQIRSLRIIFFALLAGQLIFFVTWYLAGAIPIIQDLKGIFDYLVPLFLFGSIFLSKFIYRILINKVKDSTFVKKLEGYKNAVIVSLAILESANFMAITAYMLTGEILYAAASLIMFLLFIINAPSEDKFRAELELTPEELSHTE
jgi:hypothetical protein